MGTLSRLKNLALPRQWWVFSIVVQILIFPFVTIFALNVVLAPSVRRYTRVVLPNIASRGAGEFYGRDFGTLEDGTTDDTAALQRAIDAAKKVNGQVTITGPCLISSVTLVGPDGVNGASLHGTDKIRARLICRSKGPGGMAIVVRGSSGQFSNISVDNLTIDALDVAGERQGTAIYIENVCGVSIRNVKIVKQQNGIVLINKNKNGFTESTRISDCVFEYNNNGIILDRGSGDVSFRDTQISGCIFDIDRGQNGIVTKDGSLLYNSRIYCNMTTHCGAGDQARFMLIGGIIYNCIFGIQVESQGSFHGVSGLSRGIVDGGTLKTGYVLANGYIGPKEAIEWVGTSFGPVNGTLQHNIPRFQVDSYCGEYRLAGAGPLNGWMMFRGTELVSGTGNDNRQAGILGLSNGSTQSIAVNAVGGGKPSGLYVTYTGTGRGLDTAKAAAAIFGDGDFESFGCGTGVILTSPNGRVTKRIAIDNDGSLAVRPVGP